jgi:LacI family transcriptional regulator
MDDNGSVTIHDVAKRAGVAVSSVSRALNDHPDVSPQMRARVLTAARKLGYSPDPAAQSLRSGSTKTIGYIVRDFENPLFLDNIHGMEETVTSANYTLLVTNSGGDPINEVERIQILKKRRVDALVLSSISDRSSATRKAVAEFGGPVVLLDRDFGKVAAGNVRLDHVTGVHEATSHLLALGHHRVALITGPRNIRPTRERLKGFERAHSESGIQPDSDLQVTGKFSSSFIRETTVALMNRPASRRPTAIIAGGIQSTVGLLEGLSDLDIRPGEGISVVVCDDLPWLRVLRPRLSVVTRDPAEMGRAAARMALAMIAGESPSSVMLPTSYEARETSSPPVG